MTNYNAGTASIKVGPDFTGFKAKFEAKLESLIRDFSVKVKLDLDGEGRVEATLDEITRDRTVDVNTRFNDRGVKRELKDLEKNREILVQAAFDGAKARKDLDKQLEKYGIDKPVDFDIEVNEKSLTKAMERVRKTLKSGKISNPLGEKALSEASAIDKIDQEIHQRRRKMQQLERNSQLFIERAQDAMLTRNQAMLGAILGDAKKLQKVYKQLDDANTNASNARATKAASLENALKNARRRQTTADKPQDGYSPFSGRGANRKVVFDLKKANASSQVREVLDKSAVGSSPLPHDIRAAKEGRAWASRFDKLTDSLEKAQERVTSARTTANLARHKAAGYEERGTLGTVEGIKAIAQQTKTDAALNQSITNLNRTQAALREHLANSAPLERLSERANMFPKQRQAIAATAAAASDARQKLAEHNLKEADRRLERRAAAQVIQQIGRGRYKIDLKLDRDDIASQIEQAVHGTPLGRSNLKADTSAIAAARRFAAEMDRLKAREQNARSDFQVAQYRSSVERAKLEEMRANPAVHGRDDVDNQTIRYSEAQKRVSQHQATLNDVQSRRSDLLRHDTSRDDLNVRAGRSGSGRLLDGFRESGNHVMEAVSKVMLLARTLSSVATIAASAAAAVGLLGAVNLAPLIASAAQAAGAIALIPAAAAQAGAGLAAIAVGSSGIKKVFQDASAADEALSGGGAERSAKAVASAQKNLQNAYRDAGRAARDGADQIASAERSVVDANRSALQSTKDLTNARKDARREIEDMNASLTGLALDEEDASLNREEARQRYTELLTSGRATGTDLKRAQLNIKRADYNYDEIKRRNSNEVSDIGEANRKGVEGSDRVQSALENQRRAYEQVADAQKNLAKTHEDVAQRNADAMDRIAEAQSALADAMSESGGGAAMKRFMDGLDKLAPSAKDFVLRLRDMKGAWTEFRNAVQQPLFLGIGQEVQDLAKNYLPLLRDGLAGIAQVVNKQVKGAFADLNSTNIRADISGILDDSAKSTDSLLGATRDIGRAFIGLSSGGGDHWVAIARDIESSAGKFESFISRVRADGSLDTYLGNAIDKARQLGSMFADSSRIVSRFFAADGGQGDMLMFNLQHRLEDFANRLKSDKGLQQSIAGFFQGAYDIWARMSSVVYTIAGAIKNALLPALSTVKDATEPILNAMLGLVDAAGSLVGWIQRIPGVSEALGLAAALYTLTKIVGMVKTLGATMAATGLAKGLGAAALGASFARMNTVQPSAQVRAANGISTAMTGARTAASGLAGLLGGPIGIGLIATAATVGTIIENNKKWQKSQEDVADAVRRTKDDVDAAYKRMANGDPSGRTGLANAQVSGLNAQIAARRGAPTRHGVGGLWNQVTTGAGIFFTGETDGQNRLDESTDREDARRQYQSVIDQNGFSQGDITDAVAGNGDAYDRMQAAFRNAGASSNELWQNIVKANQETNSLAQQADRVPNSFKAVSDAVQALANKYDTAATKAERLVAAARALSGDKLTADEADAAVSKRADELSTAPALDSSKGIGGALLKQGGGVDATLVNGGQLLSDVQALGSHIAAYRAAGLDAGAAAQKAAPEIAALSERFRLQNTDIVNLLTHYQFLNGGFDLVTQGATDAQKSLATMSTEFERARQQGDKSFVTNFEKAIPVDAIKALETAGVAFQKRANGQVEIFTQQSDVAMAAIRNMLAEQKKLGSTNVDLSKISSAYVVESEKVKAILRGIDQTKVDPQVGLIIDGLLAGKAATAQELSAIQNSNVSPEVKLGIEQAILNSGIVKSELNSIPPEKRIDVILNFQTKQAGLLSAVQQGTLPEVKAIPGEAPADTLKRQQENQRALDEILKLTGGAPGGKYRGGRLRGYAGGGQLPATGPGTQRRDGFIALGPDGQPLVNLDAREWIIRGVMADKYNNVLGMINRDDPRVQGLAGYAGGGKVGGGAGGAGGATNEKQLNLAPVENPFAPVTNGVQELATQVQAGLGQEAAGAYAQFGTVLATTTAATVAPSLASTQQQVVDLGATTGATITGQINPAVAALGKTITDTKAGGIDPAFQGINDGLVSLGGGFQTGVANIDTAWSRLKETTAAPARFAINTVFSDGLAGAWNAVSDIIGTQKMTVGKAAFKTGGVLPGYTPGADVHKFMSPTGGELHLSGGEAIMRPEWTRAVGGPQAVARMNAAAQSGRGPAAALMGGDHFQGGGTVALGNISGPGITTLIQQKAWDIVRGAFPNAVLSSATRTVQTEGHADFHNMGIALDFGGPLDGLPPIAMWLKQNFPDSREIFFDTIPGVNTKNGATTSPIGGHADHVHWAAPDRILGGVANLTLPGALNPGMFPGGVGGTVDPEAARKSVQDMVARTIDPFKKTVAGAIGGFAATGGVIKQLPGMASKLGFDKLETKAVEEGVKKFTSGVGLPGLDIPMPGIGGGGNVERWRPMVIAALQRQGFVPDKRNQDLMLAQIGSESGGNDKIVQGVQDVNSGGNEAAGLLQVVPGTFAANRDPGIPGDRFDGWANMNAALRYYKGKYGMDLSKMWGKGHGYDSGGIFPDGTIGYNQSGKPEAVFTNKQWIKIDALVKSLTDPKIYAALTGEKAPEWAIGTVATADGKPLNGTGGTAGAPTGGTATTTSGSATPTSSTPTTPTGATGTTPPPQIFDEKTDPNGLGELVSNGVVSPRLTNAFKIDSNSPVLQSIVDEAKKGEFSQATLDAAQKAGIDPKQLQAALNARKAWAAANAATGGSGSTGGTAGLPGASGATGGLLAKMGFQGTDPTDPNSFDPSSATQLPFETPKMSALRRLITRIAMPGFGKAYGPFGGSLPGGDRTAGGLYPGLGGATGAATTGGYGINGINNTTTQQIANQGLIPQASNPTLVATGGAQTPTPTIPAPVPAPTTPVAPMPAVPAPVTPVATPESTPVVAPTATQVPLMPGGPLPINPVEQGAPQQLATVGQPEQTPAAATDEQRRKEMGQGTDPLIPEKKENPNPFAPTTPTPAGEIQPGQPFKPGVPVAATAAVSTALNSVGAGAASPLATWAMNSGMEWANYFKDNWQGMAESLVGGVLGFAGNVSPGGGAPVININGGIRTNSWNDAQKQIDRGVRRSVAGYRSPGGR